MSEKKPPNHQPKEALKLISAFSHKHGSTRSVGHAEGVAGRQFQHLQDTGSKTLQLAHRQSRSSSLLIKSYCAARTGPGHSAPKPYSHQRTTQQQVFSLLGPSNATKELAAVMTIHSSFSCQIPNGGCIIWIYIIGDSRRIRAFHKRHEKRDELIMRHGVNQWTLYNNFTAIKTTVITINKVVWLNEAPGSKQLD